jgi:hypothetical protein
VVLAVVELVLLVHLMFRQPLEQAVLEQIHLLQVLQLPTQEVAVVVLRMEQ